MYMKKRLRTKLVMTMITLNKRLIDIDRGITNNNLVTLLWKNKCRKQSILHDKSLRIQFSLLESAFPFSYVNRRGWHRD